MERYTRKMAEGMVYTIAVRVGANEGYRPGAIYLSRESGVYRVRLILAGGGERDLSPAMTTAREVWLWARGVCDGLDSTNSLRAQIAEEWQ